MHTCSREHTGHYAEADAGMCIMHTVGYMQTLQAVVQIQQVHTLQSCATAIQNLARMRSCSVLHACITR